MSEKHFYDRLYYNYNEFLWRADPKAIYGFHLESILSKLADILGDTYHDFRFVVYDHQMHLPLPDFKIAGQDVILIFLADENSTVPLEICDKFFAIFKAYYPLEENVRNILAFPIGYSNSASLTRLIPFKERKYFTDTSEILVGSESDEQRSAGELSTRFRCENGI